MNLTDIIPSDLIDYAEKRGACHKALVWLRAAPRTWQQLIDYSPKWAGWAAGYVFASCGDYEAAEQLCVESKNPGYWRGQCAVGATIRGDYDLVEQFLAGGDASGYFCGACAVETVRRGDYDRAEQFLAKSDDPLGWRGQCAVGATIRGDYEQAERFLAKSDNPEYWRDRCAYAAMRKEVK
jgi:hypothetical protein